MRGLARCNPLLNVAGSMLTIMLLTAPAQADVTPFLKRSCHDCHNRETKEGGLDLTSHGFDNIGAALDLSPVQTQRYMEAAGMALDACVRFGPRPEPKRTSPTKAGK